GFVPPVSGLVQIFRDAASVGASNSHGVLRERIALVSRFSIPLCGLGEVLVYAQSFCVERSQIGLGIGETLLGGLTQAVRGFGIILVCANAARIALRQGVEALGVVSGG